MISAVAAAQARLKASPLARRFLGGAVWSVLGSVVSSGATLLMLMLLARLLGKETYGQFVVVQSTLGMVGVFAGVGVGAAATRYAAELKHRDPVRLGHILTLSERTVLGFGLLASAGLALAADWMAARILNAPSLNLPLALSAPAILFTALDNYQKSVLIGFESMRAFAVGTAGGVVAGFPIMLLAADRYGLQGAAAALVVNAFLQAGISRYQMARELKCFGVRRKAKGCMGECSILWHFAFPALLAGGMVGPAHWAAQALLANTSTGYAEVAVLGIAMQWFNVVMFVPGTASRVVMPMLTDHVTQNDHGNSRKILLYAMGANALVAAPLAVSACALSPYIMKLYGKSFEHDNITLMVAVITAALVAIQTPVGNLLAASSRMWLGALMNAGWAMVYVGASCFMAEKGARGIMLSLATAYLAHTVWVGCFSIKELWKKGRD